MEKEQTLTLLRFDTNVDANRAREGFIAAGARVEWSPFGDARHERVKVDGVWTSRSLDLVVWPAS